jgi:hypothetical protein
LKATSQMDWSTFNPIKPDNGIWQQGAQ